MPKSCRIRKGARRRINAFLAVCCPGSFRHVTRGPRIDPAAQQNCIPARGHMRKRMYFASDNTAGMAPEILDAVARANTGYALGYGNDEWTRRVEARFAEIFEKEVAVF